MAYVTYDEAASKMGVKKLQLMRVFNSHKKKFKNLKKVGVSYIWDTEEHIPLFRSLLKNNVVGQMKQAVSVESKKLSPSVNQKEKTVKEIQPTENETVDWAFSGEGQENENASSVMHYADARTKREYYTALQSKMDYERRMGKLIPSDAVSDIWKSLTIATQKSLLTIPDRVAPLCVGIKDQKIIHNLLKTELRYALKNLSLELKDILPEIETVQVGSTEKTQVLFPQKKTGKGRPNGHDL